MFYGNVGNIDKPLIIIIVLLFLLIFHRHIYDGTDFTKSKLDNKYYRVRSNHGKESKADLLALINMKLNLIVNNLKISKYNTNPNVQRLIGNWNRGVSIKEIGKMESDAAYVINKQYMSFCLPENTAKSLDNVNLMTYVGIHELSHIMSIETGHGDEFIANFQFLLDYSKQLYYFDPYMKTNMPIYIQLNKLNTADNYCGVALQNSIK
jgi:hypothetical protein